MSDSKTPKRDFAQEFYFTMREAATGKRMSRDQKRIEAKASKAKSKPFDRGRDPVSAISSVNDLVGAFRWTGEMAEAELHVKWAEIVGADTAANSMPEDLVDGTRTVRCKSTVWATQLRLMGNVILERLNAEFAELNITSLKMLGPTAPSWKKGPRSVPGRGPRDTYG
jgi:predicted nucleic acid-binding Zn ribbon protein